MLDLTIPKSSQHNNLIRKIFKNTNKELLGLIMSMVSHKYLNLVLLKVQPKPVQNEPKTV